MERRDTRVNRLIKALSESNFSNKLIVFGSVAAGKLEPVDLDVVLDARDCECQRDAEIVYANEMNQLMGLAKRHYGFLDPFVLTRRDLYVRNDVATGWQAARNKKGIKAAIESGKRLMDIAFKDSQDIDILHQDAGAQQVNEGGIIPLGPT